MLDNLSRRCDHVVENNAKVYLEHAKSKFQMRLAEINGANANEPRRQSVHLSEHSDDSENQENMDEAD